MEERRKGLSAPRALLNGAAGLAAGSLAGLALLVVAGVAVANRVGSSGDGDAGALIEATHVPPLLSAPGDPPELRYDIYCAAPGRDPEGGAPCNASGSVYVRPGLSGRYRQIPLVLDTQARQGRYVARLPADVAASPSGYSYYAVVHDEISGAETTIPAGGAVAPQLSVPLGQTVRLGLGSHAFGRAQAASQRVASAAWGDGAAQVGLEDGPQAAPVGAASFDVDRSGAVTVLDEAHRRLLRFSPGSAQPTAIPVAVNGTLADMAVAPDGSVYVLETAGQPAGETPLLRSFAPDGRATGAWHTAERTVSALRMGPDGPETLDYPDSQWMPVVRAGAALDRRSQEQGGRSGRSLPGGGDVVVLRTGNEVRVALTSSNGARKSWRIFSDTPMAEVQLAEPLSSHLVLVFRVYTDSRDEFVALVLDDHGIARQLSLDSVDWAETAPLARFRLVGSSLYQLGSTSKGMFVDRFDLGVTR
jgi:hypothetical protein